MFAVFFNGAFSNQIYAQFVPCVCFFGVSVCVLAAPVVGATDRVAGGRGPQVCRDIRAAAQLPRSNWLVGVAMRSTSEVGDDVRSSGG